jgi:23S rRNA pseudouridine1911/1915/1917 synthase
MSNPSMSSLHGFRVVPPAVGTRLDASCGREIEHCSRSFATSLIRQGCITVDGLVKKPGYAVKAGETVAGRIPTGSVDFLPENIPLHILYEDADCWW